MRAGAKFPTVIERRLAECKVMLVLIGPDWLNARSGNGDRRIDDPDDWVRLEIAHALRRNVAVIPVRVNGAELPLRKLLLGYEIRGLLDHQAASVSLTGFRNDMAGIVRDIRSIPNSLPWTRYGAAAGAIVLVVAAIAALQLSGNISDRTPSDRDLPVVPKPTETRRSNEIWVSTPGEWVLYGTANVGSSHLSHFFKSKSLKIYGHRVAYDVRYTVASPNSPITDAPNLQAVYEDVTNVLDCKKVDHRNVRENAL